MRQMYDAVDPRGIPRDAEMVAGYLDGSQSRWPAEAWGWFPNAVKVQIVINPALNAGHVLDIEPGNWPASASVDWVLMRRAAGVEPTVYCGTWAPGYTWQDVLDAHDARGVPRPQIWLAYYDRIAVIPDGCVAKQYASDSMLGTGYDASVVVDYWPGVDAAPQPAEDYLADAANARDHIAKAVEHLQAATADINY